jgi:cobalt-zinc-cadmium efflux system outer membrane protein
MDASHKLMAAMVLVVGLAGSVQGQVRRESLDIPPEPVPVPLPSREPGDDASDLGTNREQAARPDARPGVTSLTIADLEEMALCHNPTMAQAARYVAALEGKHVQSGLHPNPTVGYLGEEMGDEGSAGQQGMFIEQRLVTGGKLSLNRAVVSHEIQRAQQSLEMQRLRVLTHRINLASDDLPPDDRGLLASSF